MTDHWHGHNEQHEHTLKLRDTDPERYERLPAVAKDHAQIYEDVREVNKRRAVRPDDTTTFRGDAA
jgi:hypothetical protein